MAQLSGCFSCPKWRPRDCPHCSVAGLFEATPSDWLRFLRPVPSHDTPGRPAWSATSVASDAWEPASVAHGVVYESPSDTPNTRARAGEPLSHPNVRPCYAFLVKRHSCGFSFFWTNLTSGGFFLARRAIRVAHRQVMRSSTGSRCGGTCSRSGRCWECAATSAQDVVFFRNDEVEEGSK